MRIAQRRPWRADRSTTDLKAALDSRQGGRRGARRLPVRAVHRAPALRLPNVVVTPHLGASTAEATDRAGVQAAEQVVAALTGGVVTNAVNIPAVAAEEMEVLAAVRAALPNSLGRLAQGLGRRLGRPGRSRVPRTYRRPRHAAARHRRSLSASSPVTPRRRSTSSTRRRWPRSAGSSSSRRRHSSAEDFTELVTRDGHLR